MRPPGAPVPNKVLLLWLLVIVTGFGCATSSPTGTRAPSAEVAPGTAAEQPATAHSSTASLPVRAPGAPAPRTHIAVLLNDPVPGRMDLLKVFAVELGRPYEVLNLANRTPAEIRARLRELAPAQVVTLGPAALAAASGVPGTEIIHAGVFDPGDSSRGIDALPPFDVQLEHWLARSPDLARIGVLGGEAMADRMSDLAAACAARGLVLESRRVTSDKESLRAFRTMLPHIDGFVFLPDEAVLSPTVIQQMMVHGRRNELEILVYSPLMLELGGTLLLQPEPVAVARGLIELLQTPGLEVTVRKVISRQPDRQGDSTDVGRRLELAEARDG